MPRTYLACAGGRGGNGGNATQESNDWDRCCCPEGVPPTGCRVPPPEELLCTAWVGGASWVLAEEAARPSGRGRGWCSVVVARMPVAAEEEREKRSKADSGWCP
ncbi:unnamed protein product, partial [Ectocarpus sp. 4 AP-2014]